MNKPRIISLALAVLLLSPDVWGQAQSQTGDWRNVESLTRGTQITVKARKRHSCFVRYVAATELVCTVPRPLRPANVNTFPRAEIREIRLVRDPERDMVRGAIVGAGVGAVFGSTTGKGPRSGRVLLLTPGFGMIGGCVGSFVGMFRKGKLIYKADKTPSKVSQPQPTP